MTFDEWMSDFLARNKGSRFSIADLQEKYKQEMAQRDAGQKPVITIEQQIKCVAREIALRRSVYPKLITKGRMKQSVAVQEQAAMEAVLETLKQVQASPSAGEIAATALESREQ